MRQLHDNKGPAQLRIMLNEALKPVAEPRNPGYERFTPLVLHYVEPAAVANYCAVFTNPRYTPVAFQGLAELFATQPRPVELPLAAIVTHAEQAVAAGKSKDVVYYGEIAARARRLLDRGANSFIYTPLHSTVGTNHPVALLLLEVGAR